jgi:hypothetical protein
VERAALALQMSTQIRSARTFNYLRDAGHRLLPFRKNANVQGLFNKMKSGGLS